jgi:transcriptional regulator with XRE-family HTH domain
MQWREEGAARLREQFGGRNQSEFARTHHIDQSTLSLYLKGSRRPPVEKLALLCTALRCSADYLLGLEVPSRPGFIDILRLPVILAAGAARLDIDGDATTPYAFHDDFFRRHGLDPERCAVAPLAKGYHGESMRETIQPGAMLLLDRRPITDVVTDALYVVRAPDEEGVTVKRCAIRDEQLICKPDNPTHQPFAIPLRGRQVQKIVLARVVWWANEAP